MQRLQNALQGGKVGTIDEAVNNATGVGEYDEESFRKIMEEALSNA